MSLMSPSSLSWADSRFAATSSDPFLEEAADGSGGSAVSVASCTLALVLNSRADDLLDVATVFLDEEVMRVCLILELLLLEMVSTVLGGYCDEGHGLLA
jgi:hypothetical protein